jgi:hypothetical protein
MRVLLADADFFQFVAMVLILTVIAIFSWVRKTIEKVQREQKGKGQSVDVGQAVRQQLQKYMRAAGQLPPEAPPAAPAAPAPPAPPPAARKPDAHLSKSLEREQTVPAVVLRRRAPSARRLKSSKQVTLMVRQSKFTPRDVKRAIVQAEILGPPMALRKDYRLL